MVKADKQLVKQARDLGSNVKRVVDLALEDYIRRNSCLKPEIKARKGSSNMRDGGSVETNTTKESCAGESVVTRLLFSDDIELSGLPPAFSRRSSAVACPCIPRIGRFILVGTTSASPHPRASREVSFLCHCPVSQPCSYEPADLLDGRSFLRLSPGSRPLTRRQYNF